MTPYREFSRIFGDGTTPARRDREEEMSLGAKEGRGKDKPIDVPSRA
jgi:hypothetical protein